MTTRVPGYVPRERLSRSTTVWRDLYDALGGRLELPSVLSVLVFDVRTVPDMIGDETSTTIALPRTERRLAALAVPFRRHQALAEHDGAVTTASLWPCYFALVRTPGEPPKDASILHAVLKLDRAQWMAAKAAATATTTTTPLVYITLTKQANLLYHRASDADATTVTRIVTSASTRPGDNSRSAMVVIDDDDDDDDNDSRTAMIWEYTNSLTTSGELSIQAAASALSLPPAPMVTRALRLFSSLVPEAPHILAEAVATRGGTMSLEALFEHTDAAADTLMRARHLHDQLATFDAEQARSRLLAAVREWLLSPTTEAATPPDDPAWWQLAIAVMIYVRLPHEQLPAMARVAAECTSSESVAQSMPGASADGPYMNANDAVPFVDLGDKQTPLHQCVEGVCALVLLAVHACTVDECARVLAVLVAKLAAWRAARALPGAMHILDPTASWPPRVNRVWALTSSRTPPPGHLFAGRTEPYVAVDDLSYVLRVVFPAILRQHVADVHWYAYATALSARSDPRYIAQYERFGLYAKRVWKCTLFDAVRATRRATHAVAHMPASLSAALRESLPFNSSYQRQRAEDEKAKLMKNSHGGVDPGPGAPAVARLVYMLREGDVSHLPGCVRHMIDVTKRARSPGDAGRFALGAWIAALTRGTDASNDDALIDAFGDLTGLPKYRRTELEHKVKAARRRDKPSHGCVYVVRQSIQNDAAKSAAGAATRERLPGPQDTKGVFHCPHYSDASPMSCQSDCTRTLNDGSEAQTVQSPVEYITRALRHSSLCAPETAKTLAW